MIRWTLPGGARRAALATALVAATLAVPVTAQLRDQADLDAIYRIKQEGGSNSKVMETLSYLTDVNGPRLTNSPMMHQAAEWAQKQLTAWGLANVHTEKWGPFGRGWVNEHTSIRMDAPQPFVLLGYPKAWTPGTAGEVSGDAVAVTIETDEDFAKYKGTLKGKFVLQSPTREVAVLLRVADASLHRRQVSTSCRTTRSAPLADASRAEPASAPGWRSGRSAWPSTRRKASSRSSRCRPALAVTTAR